MNIRKHVKAAVIVALVLACVPSVLVACVAPTALMLLL